MPGGAASARMYTVRHCSVGGKWWEGVLHVCRPGEESRAIARTVSAHPSALFSHRGEAATRARQRCFLDAFMDPFMMYCGQAHGWLCRN